MNKKSFFWGAAIGTLVGSVAALLFAPKAGKELRQDIAEGARQVTERTGEIAGRINEQGVQLVERVKDSIQNISPWRDKQDSNNEDLELVQVSSVLNSNEEVQ